ncbi:L-histidine N(alpha)-methyltransferase [Pedobacter sp. MC2016-15]|uniref:L-histidine N(alpha)-methyltransferase n=1 Tax=Pedobacter sp. MC2016-15 TaxID=2994473 RepID=UPI00224641FD|nr:L-histidine N(alpha)-methyltransferase [Pedobacter sp. MC2016-15]MCX2479919.1 L-histidine N(alpha)-methyltransferase [Pedobacter sp. MC2016-15]
MNQFLQEVLHDLSQTPKTLNSKYFYDGKGDKLFQEIMDCPEYYPTNCEMEIFREHTKDLAVTLKNGFNTFDLVEMGAGDATKSSFLLKELVDMKADFTYMPIDISSAMIAHLEESLPEKIEGLKIEGLNGEYFQMLEKANQISSRKKVVMLLGGNIGNETPENAVEFCRKIRSCLQEGDLVLVGFDLKKNPRTILAAYNDAAGFTRDFNLNLLHRINNELEGNFDTEQFEHYPTYDPASGACKSYLISRINQEVTISGQKFLFKENEIIDMEISQKYSLEETETMASHTGFKTVTHFLDHKKWFVDTVWQCI